MKLRVAKLASLTLVLIAVSMLGLYFLRDPRDPLKLRRGERYGVDVSAHQGQIDWVRVSRGGASFAYIKATEGGDWVDDHFAANWQAATAAGLKRGAYHFFTLKRPGNEQADNFLRTVPSDSNALPPAIDLELVGNGSSRPAPEALFKELSAFLDRIETATGKKAVLYLGDDFEARYRIKEQLARPSWEASNLTRPQGSWLIWQMDQHAHLAGIDGLVDVDIMKL